MSEPKHTPLPWKSDKADHEEPYLPIQILGPGYYPTNICTISIDDSPDPEFNRKQNANAEFIVRACNTHDEMVEVLTQCLLLMKKMFASRHDDINSLTDRILVVLEKASGQ